MRRHRHKTPPKIIFHRVTFQKYFFSSIIFTPQSHHWLDCMKEPHLWIFLYQTASVSGDKWWNMNNPLLRGGHSRGVKKNNENVKRVFQKRRGCGRGGHTGGKKSPPPLSCSRRRVTRQGPEHPGATNSIIEWTTLYPNYSRIFLINVATQFKD